MTPARDEKIIALTIFLGAFLFFQIELLFGKYLLPFFGGTSAVWITAMFTYQLILLAGYACAYHIAGRAPGKGVRLFWIIVGLVAIGMGVQTIRWGTPLLSPTCDMARSGTSQPGLRVALTILAYTGPPMLLLATTSPLLQAWYALQSDRPYRLYAVSNAGSMLGLISYPLCLEAFLPLNQQLLIWLTLFACFVGGYVYISLRIRKMHASEASESTAPGERIPPGRYIFWLFTAALGSALLLSSTNQITQDVASFPFIWMVPLCLYLLTFILCFRDGSRYRTQPYFFLLLFATLLAIRQLLAGTTDYFIIQFFQLALFLFVGCMLCHGELYRSRPAPRHLTRYYLAIAIGGLLGSFLVAFIAPLVFDHYHEFTVCLTLCWGLACLRYLQARKDDPPTPADRRTKIKHVALVVGVPLFAVLLFPNEGLVSLLSGWKGLAASVLLVLVLIGVALAYVHLVYDRGRTRVRDLGILSTLFTLLIFAMVHADSTSEHLLAASRNFYGALRVETYSFEAESRDNEEIPYNILVHGTIIHGVQFHTEPERHQPVAYYGPASGMHAALQRQIALHGDAPMRVGIAGMGIGTLSALFREQDFVDFYEINPLVIEWASNTNYFSYVSEAAATVRTIEGDARIEMERIASGPDFVPYDLLLLDAFSSDAIPIHLLTLEAMELYRNMLRPNGLIMLNVSNKHLNLSPFIQAAAERVDFEAATIVPNQELWTDFDFAANWMIMGKDLAFTREPPYAEYRYELPEGVRVRPWTDAYSNVLKAMQLRYQYPITQE